MGLPRPAHRDQSRSAAGRQKAADGGHWRCAGNACRKYAQKFLDLQREQFKRIGVFGRWDDPYSTMTPQYESVVLATFYDFLEKEFRLQGPALGLLVHPRQDRAGRSRSRIRKPHQPDGLGEVRADRRSGDDSIPRSRERKFSPSSGPPRRGRFPRPWRWPFIPTKSMSRSNPAARFTSSPSNWPPSSPAKSG